MTKFIKPLAMLKSIKKFSFVYSFSLSEDTDPIIIVIVPTKIAVLVKFPFINVGKIVWFPAKLAFWSLAISVDTLKLIIFSHFNTLSVKKIVIKASLIRKPLLQENAFFNKPIFSVTIVMRTVWQYIIKVACHLSILIFTNVQRSILFITFGESRRLSDLSESQSTELKEP